MGCLRGVKSGLTTGVTGTALLQKPWSICAVAVWFSLSQSESERLPSQSQHSHLRLPGLQNPKKCFHRDDTSGLMSWCQKCLRLGASNTQVFHQSAVATSQLQGCIPCYWVENTSRLLVIQFNYVKLNPHKWSPLNILLNRPSCTDATVTSYEEWCISWQSHSEKWAKFISVVHLI